MLGEHVQHPELGHGQVISTWRNGEEWLVRFEDGLRFRRPRSEFAGQAAPAPLPPTTGYTPPPPMPLDQLAARQLIESLRVGIAPAQHVHDLTIGLTAEQASLHAAFEQTQGQGGAVRAVIGDYGYGKSHMVELTGAEALRRNFLVASISLDLQELPPHRAFEIYRAAMSNLRYPDSDERGLGHLLTRAADSAVILPQLQHLAPVAGDPLAVALHVLGNISATRRRQMWVRWLGGGGKPRSLVGLPPGTKFPSIYTVGHNARQIAYLLTGISALARLTGYSGLCLLVDEAESYALLSPYQRPKAESVFQALIYAALRDSQQRLTAAALPQHRWRDYPPAYDAGQGLFFLFTLTRSDNRLPLHDWLDETDCFYLEPQVTPQEVGHFLAHLLTRHAQAFAYTPEERQLQVRRGAAELLAAGLRHNRLSMRQTVRLAVELFDLLFLYPACDVAQLLDELRDQVR
jgi:hypothetical protein